MNLDHAHAYSSLRGSYEEYHPYGSTAWWAGASSTVSQKRYRFTGMERDEETGLQCHGVRYYAAWLGRWVSADPIGLGDGVNRFGYCHGGPVSASDPSGMDPKDPLPSGEDVDRYSAETGNGPAMMFLDKFIELRGDSIPSPQQGVDKYALGFADLLESESGKNVSHQLVDFAETLKTESYQRAVAGAWNDAKNANSGWFADAYLDYDVWQPLPSSSDVHGIVFFVDMEALMAEEKGWFFGEDVYFDAIHGRQDLDTENDPLAKERHVLKNFDCSWTIKDSSGGDYQVAFVDASAARRQAADARLTEIYKKDLQSPDMKVREAAVFGLENSSWRADRGPEVWKAFAHEYASHFFGSKHLDQDRFRKPGEKYTDELEAKWFGWTKTRSRW